MNERDRHRAEPGLLDNRTMVIECSESWDIMNF